MGGSGSDRFERDGWRIDAQLLSDLWVFRAVARGGSMSAAATELSVTAGAVSQRVLRLEARLNTKLFERKKSKLTLTEPGSSLLDAMNGYGPESKVTVSRLAEPIQVEPELLVQLDEGGIRPGAAVSLERVGEYISVRVPGFEGALELPPEVAAHVFVQVD